MSVKALEYAERTLGVHEVYQEAQAFSDRLAKTLEDLDKARANKRTFEERILDGEAMLLTSKRSMHPDMSEAQFKSLYSGWRRQDPMLMQLREDLNDALLTIDLLQSNADVLKADIRIRTARLEELGGYLHYLAAIKAEQTNQANSV